MTSETKQLLRMTTVFLVAILTWAVIVIVVRGVARVFGV